MQPERHSRSAISVAFARAHHHLHHEPKVLDDPYAHRLLTAAETAELRDMFVGVGRELGIQPDTGDLHALLSRTMREATGAPLVLARARYAEDRLTGAIEKGVCQYVLVGAGLDTFALRRYDLRERLQVFELDHPRSQALKRERLQAAGLDVPDNLHFGAVDFQRESIADALGRLSFRRDRPAFFAWLGVTYYLTRPAIELAWRSMRAVAAPGSHLVFDFVDPEALSESASAAARKLRDRLRSMGEPLITAFTPSTLRAELRDAGWALVELLDAAAIDRHYLAGTGYRIRPTNHVAWAVTE
jgi:methyltransferase (TIGR00027 family)